MLKDGLAWSHVEDYCEVRHVLELLSQPPGLRDWSCMEDRNRFMRWRALRRLPLNRTYDEAGTFTDFQIASRIDMKQDLPPAATMSRKRYCFVGTAQQLSMANVRLRQLQCQTVLSSTSSECRVFHIPDAVFTSYSTYTTFHHHKIDNELPIRAR